MPTAWPDPNLLLVFGVLLAVGVLGGLLSARVRWLPTITGFMAVGALIGPSGLGLLSPQALAGSRVLVEVALGLILFKLGAALHPVKALRDRRLVTTSLAESLGTFVVIFGLLLWIEAPAIVAVLVGAIAVSSSPAVLIHVAEELHAEGPVLEHAESLVAANNVLSFILFSLALPFALLGERFGFGGALAVPAYQLVGAVLVALLVAWLVTRVARLTRLDEEHFRFALVVGAVMLALGLAQAFKVSTLFAGLALGIACRWLQGRSRLTRVEFGGGGDVFFIILFVSAGANLHLQEVAQYAPLALAFVGARVLVKVGAVYGCGRAFGGTTRTALAGGLLLVPMAGLAIGLVHSTSALLPELSGRIAALVLASVAIFETIGPPIAAFALRLAGEVGAAAREETSASLSPRVAPTVGKDADGTGP